MSLCLLGVLGITFSSYSASTLVTAAEKEVKVGYIAGGVTVDPNASVVIPTGVMFSDTTSTVDTSVQLMAIKPDGPSNDVSGLPTSFKVEVKVKSTNGYTLNNQKYTQKGEYKLGYKVANEAGTLTYFDKNTANSTSDQAIGTLNNQRQKITGEAQMTATPNVTALTGDLFQDTLTYKLTVTK